MSSFSSILASYVFNGLWQIPLLAITGWLICRLLRRLGAAIEHRVWVAVLFFSVVLPAGRALRLLGIPQTALPMDGSASVRLLTLQPIAIHQPALLILPPILITAVSDLYLATLLFFLLRFTASILSAIQTLKESQPLLLEADLSNAWHDAKGFFGLSGIRILRSSVITGPVTLSLGRPVLLLPKVFAESTSVQDFHVALAHECAHMKRNDFLKNSFYEVVSTFIAFHPVTWLIKAQIAQTREMTCDAMAVEAVGGPRVYVPSLLRLASAIASCPPARTLHAIGIFDANILEKRIMILRTKKKATSVAQRYGLIFAGGLGLFLAVAGGATAAVGLSPERASDTVNERQNEQIYKVGTDVSAPVLLSAPQPDYPSSARQKKGSFKGICLIGLIVDASGKPRDVHVVRSLSKDFDENSVKAVEQYRFSPAEHLGKAVSVALNIEVKFEKF